MSSLNAARADNFYYPPDWDPSQGSLNASQGVHPLGQRANKLHLGILQIRFEMPFNVWCTHCDKMIGKGVRYNAEKKQVGMYFSTKIFEFSMICHECFGVLKVRTDPKNRDYAMTFGLKKKTQTWDAKANGTQELLDDEEKGRMAADPMFRLDHTEEREQKAKSKKSQLVELHSIQDRHYDDYEMSRRMRRKLRGQKKEGLVRDKEAKALGLPYQLLPHSKNDEQIAKLVQFSKISGLSATEKLRQQHRMHRASSIFGKRTVVSKGEAKNIKAMEQRKRMKKRLVHKEQASMLGESEREAFWTNTEEAGYLDPTASTTDFNELLEENPLTYTPPLHEKEKVLFSQNKKDSSFNAFEPIAFKKEANSSRKRNKALIKCDKLKVTSSSPPLVLDNAKCRGKNDCAAKGTKRKRLDECAAGAVQSNASLHVEKVKREKVKKERKKSKKKDREKEKKGKTKTNKKERESKRKKVKLEPEADDPKTAVKDPKLASKEQELAAPLALLAGYASGSD